MTSLKAIIHSILEGKHGPYAVATVEELEGSVTISLSPDCWMEKELPAPGSVVFLMGINQKRAGWRAAEGRFWRPSDEQQRASLTVRSNDFVEFVRLTSKQFPHFDICEQIVLRAEERNWNIPGMEFIFDECGSGERKFRYLRYIKGRDFKIHFYAKRQDDSAKSRKLWPSDIIIPGLELGVYEDESGPTMYWYVGKDWEADREWFLNGSKIHSLLDQKPRRYLRYKGSESIERGNTYYYQGKRPPYLIFDNDCGREYSPEGDEPRYFVLDDILKKVTEWLDENVLGSIQMVPPAKERIPYFIAEEKIPWPENIGPLFTYTDNRGLNRISLGKKDFSNLKPEERFALEVGLRLVSLDTTNDGTIPEMAYDGFIWCGMGQARKGMTLEKQEIAGLYGSWLVNVISVQPKYANHIYVADISVRDEYKAKWFENHPETRFLTKEAYAEYCRTAGRTLIPIEKYDGGYKQPVVLINRELGLDEVELV